MSKDVGEERRHPAGVWNAGRRSIPHAGKLPAFLRRPIMPI